MGKKKYNTEEERKEAEKLRKKTWAIENKEKISVSKKKYNDNNKEKIAEAGKLYRNNNKEKEVIRHLKYSKEQELSKLESAKKYREKNRYIINQKARLNNIKRNENHKKRYGDDIVYKLSCNIRTLIRISFKRNGFNKNSRTNKIIGFTFDKFKEYLESKFEPWMNWDNHGKYNGELNFGWDIDHIIPISSAKTEEDVIKLNYYTNLQPLCSKVNRDIKKHHLIHH